MAAIAAAQAQVNGQGRDDSRGNSGEYWVRSNSEEDMERADSGGLQVSHFVLAFFKQFFSRFFKAGCTVTQGNKFAHVVAG